MDNIDMMVTIRDYVRMWERKLWDTDEAIKKIGELYKIKEDSQ